MIQTVSTVCGVHIPYFSFKNSIYSFQHPYIFPCPPTVLQSPHSDPQLTQTHTPQRRHCLFLHFNSFPPLSTHAPPSLGAPVAPQPTRRPSVRCPSAASQGPRRARHCQAASTHPPVPCPPASARVSGAVTVTYKLQWNMHTHTHMHALARTHTQKRTHSSVKVALRPQTLALGYPGG